MCRGALGVWNIAGQDARAVVVLLLARRTRSRVGRLGWMWRASGVIEIDAPLSNISE
jgi:hypothetical protein